MEQTKNNAGAFVDEASVQWIMVSATCLTTWRLNCSLVVLLPVDNLRCCSFYSAPTLSFVLANSQQVVQFEVGMTLQASATDGGAALQNTPGTIDAIQITSVNRGTGAIRVRSSVLHKLHGVLTYSYKFWAILEWWIFYHCWYERPFWTSCMGS